MNIFVGTAGFSYKDWEGVVYPADLKKRRIHPLEYLAQFFDCCEINTSFYGHIRPNVGKSWCDKTAAVNPNFQFTAKLFRPAEHHRAPTISVISPHGTPPMIASIAGIPVAKTGC